jgi:hypothetical protein
MHCAVFGCILTRDMRSKILSLLRRSHRVKKSKL